MLMTCSGEYPKSTRASFVAQKICVGNPVPKSLPNLPPGSAVPRSRAKPFGTLPSQRIGKYLRYQLQAFYQRLRPVALRPQGGAGYQ